MDDLHIDNMVRALKPVLKDPIKARAILERYWRTRIALVWTVDDVYRAANERSVAVTRTEAIEVLADLHCQHNMQCGIKWEDLITRIEDHGLGRKLTRAELHRFVHQDRLIVRK
jgi:hypothetical protein